MAPSQVVEILKNDKRYARFNFFNRYETFKDIFYNKNYDVVNIYDMTFIFILNNIVGLVGSFKYQDNSIRYINMAKEKYNENMKVYGFNEYISEGKMCLDILATDWKCHH